MQCTIPLHHPREHTQSVMAALPTTFGAMLKQRANLMFFMAQVAETVGRQRMLRYPKDAVFGGFTAEVVGQRIRDAYQRPGPPQPPPLTKKQLARAEAAERFKDKVRSQVSLTNYEQSKFYASRHKGKRPEDFVGIRNFSGVVIRG